MGWEGILKDWAYYQNIPTLLDALRDGEFEIGEYLDKVETQFDAVEAQVLAFLPERERFERLRQEAEELFVRYPDPEARPPLFGLPIGVKDIFHVAGFPTQAGSLLPSEVITGEEAECVTQLKKAGALILGKTVTTEFAYFGPGPTRNPYNPEHTPGGSSSGSAAAVAVGLVPFAFGTQTIGSIARPASFCGVVGYKPSYDRISKAGVIPLASSVDHIGFFTADVPSALPPAQSLCKDWKKGASRKKKLVLGIPTGPYLHKASEEMQAHFNKVCEQLESGGYRLKSIEAMPDFDEIAHRHGVIVAAEAYQVHEAWYDQYGDLYHSKTVELIQRGKAIPPDELAQARQGREKLRQELMALMDEHKIDLWLSPGAPDAAPKGLDSTGDPVMNLPWTHSGLPTLCLPSGLNRAGLPLGLQVAGRWYEDEKLLHWGVGLESVLNSV
jgi:Asp-tRNA(Asn)/Glu-tRNA(Gln) amidotransferase A subunit family amidase